jgi:isochorismate synthase
MPEVLHHTISITQVLRICLGKNIHFAAYRLPGSASTQMVIQKDPEMKALENLNEALPQRGFLIAPFSWKQDKTYLIKPDILIQDIASTGQLHELESLPEIIMPRSLKSWPEDTRREDYIQLIQDTIGRIQASEFEKVVLSRIKAVTGSFTERLPDIFSILCESYPNAFVYLFCVNGQCWTGATPEPFICSRGKELITVSLAGTRTYQQKDLDISNWNGKELQEQDYVTFHIEKILKNYSVDAYTRKGPYVASAGNLLHLRTDFSFSAHSVGTRLPSLINALHPTPAVCGMSTGKAMDFIMNTEKHNREYYTGFLGPIGLGDLIQLYVNLRCMKVLHDRLVLFIGGGITLESVAEEEWEETEIKAETLLSVLHQVM